MDAQKLARQKRLEAFRKLSPLAKANVAKDGDKASATTALTAMANEMAKSGEAFKVQVNILGSGGGPMLVTTAAGKGTVAPAAKLPSDMQVELSTDTYNQIVAGKLSPVAAFYTGKMSFGGDLGAAKRLLAKLGVKTTSSDDINL